ncbi:MAG: hypothetical protein CL920_30060 [Deltaproteobacteria bacterium]|nr:hypothetical protein [Deltaproteobacteria bacterium]MBU52957.1 hypothetical protein [Deltaproteobacteria bacterium]
MGKQEQQNRHTTSSSASFPWTGLKRQPSGWFRSALSWFACLWFCSFVACYVTPASDVNLPCLKHDDCSLGLYCIQHVCSTQRPTEQSEEKSAEQPTKDASEPFEDPTGEPLPETSPEVECVPGPVTRACYTGKDGTAGVGMCAFGKERCTAEGKWSGVCEGEIKPQVESCNQTDDDCDGAVDEELDCCTEAEFKSGVEKTCYGSDDGGCVKKQDGTWSCRGHCKTGKKTCEKQPDGTYEWSKTCTGDILVTPEDASIIDRNCDGRLYFGADGVVDTFIGTPRFQDGALAQASFYLPTGMSYDKSNQRLYVADAHNYRIRVVDFGSSTVSTLSGNGKSTFELKPNDVKSTQLSFPSDVLYNNGKLYVSDSVSHVILEYTLTTTPPTVKRIAGKVGVDGDADGKLGKSLLYSPQGMTLSGDGNTLYFADTYNHKIRSIDLTSADYTVSTVAGHKAGDSDGPNDKAGFRYPASVLWGGVQQLYVVDRSNHLIRVVRLEASDLNTATVAGISGIRGDLNGVGVSSTFNHPQGITWDATARKLYITEMSNHQIRQIDLSVSGNSVATFAGSQIGYKEGKRDKALFAGPHDIEMADRVGEFFVLGYYSGRIRKIDVNGNVTTAAGVGMVGDVQNKTPWAQAHFAFPLDLVVDTNQNVYIADRLNHSIKKYDHKTGEVEQLAGGGVAGDVDDIDPKKALFAEPHSLAIGPSGRVLYIADRFNHKIRALDLQNNKVSTFFDGRCKAATAPPCLQDGALNQATMGEPFFLRIGPNGDYLYFTTVGKEAHAIRRIALKVGSEKVETLAGGKVGYADGVGAAALFAQPTAFAFDPANNNIMYIVDHLNNRIRKLNIATKEVTTLAGNGDFKNVDDTDGTKASFWGPYGISVGPNATKLYITEYTGQTIRTLSLTAPYGVQTVTGKAQKAGLVNGPLNEARLYTPSHIVYDKTRKLFLFAEQFNGRIRSYQPTP